MNRRVLLLQGSEIPNSHQSVAGLRQPAFLAGQRCYGWQRCGKHQNNGCQQELLWEHYSKFSVDLQTQHALFQRDHAEIVSYYRESDLVTSKR